MLKLLWYRCVDEDLVEYIAYSRSAAFPYVVSKRFGESYAFNDNNLLKSSLAVPYITLRTTSLFYTQNCFLL